MTNKETLREEWNKEANKKHWGACFECCDFERIVDESFDFFWDKLEQIRNEDKKRLVKKINQRKTVKAQMVFKSYDEPVSNSGYIQGLDFVLDLIKQDNINYKSIINKPLKQFLSDEQIDLEDEAYHAMIDDELSFNK